MTRDFKWAQDFKCAHCHGYVSGEPLLSGVRNRNHCPYCLWSRHLDLYQSGDRLSACKAGMQPVGLTLKITWKKYRFSEGGELMLIHQCIECESLSINRIAADDDAERIFDLFEGSLEMGDNKKAQLAAIGVIPLAVADRATVSTRLFGSMENVLFNYTEALWD